MTDESTLPVDPNVKVPAGVRAVIARTDELFKVAQEAQAAEQEARDARDAQEMQEFMAAQEAQPAAGDVTRAGNVKPGAESDERQDRADRAGAVAQDTGAQEDTQKSADDGAEDWKHKYKTVHGRFLRAQENLKQRDGTIREQAEVIQNLQNIIATMQAPPSAETVVIPELDADATITTEEANDYGEDFLKVVGKKAREELAPVIRKLAAENERLKAQLSTVSSAVHQSAQEKLLSKLDQEIPQWRELNTDERFLEWLRLPDPYSGAIRHDMLKAAYAQGNPSRVRAFFEGFLAQEAAVAPARDEPNPKTVTVDKVPLETLAAPGRAKTAASAQAPAGKPYITRAQIAAFYADVASGKYRGRDTEKAKAEAMIFEAQRNGRIR